MQKPRRIEAPAARPDRIYAGFRVGAPRFATGPACSGRGSVVDVGANGKTGGFDGKWTSKPEEGAFGAALVAISEYASAVNERRVLREFALVEA